ncbi:hypothetical protein HRI96_05570 [Treponema parvum]|uniref:Uncharacterized protein n=1 Tax=Treponema parvum TaxID=138851 RepID=A0A975ICH2_9SPIR|nr:hypothetical protein [Treponema parvum]QTQ11713.1 hypothetical protein HRI96_05570 [Treponema parvum]
MYLLHLKISISFGLLISLPCLYAETVSVTTFNYSKAEKYTTNYQIEFKKGSVIERVLIDNKIVFDAENAQVKHFSFGADTDPERLEVTWTDSVLSVRRGPKGNAGDSFSITMQEDKKNLGKSIFIIKRFERNFLQDIPMKYFAVSFFDNSAAAQNHGV